MRFALLLVAMSGSLTVLWAGRRYLGVFRAATLVVAALAAGVVAARQIDSSRLDHLEPFLSALSVVAGFSLAQGAVKLRRRGLGGDKDSWRTP
jgi:hypothetical protein